MADAQTQSELPDLTTYREPELPPEQEELEEDVRVEKPSRNAVVEGDDAPTEEETEEEESEEEELFEDTIDISTRNEFGDDKNQAVVIRGSKDAVERVKTERMLHADYTRKTTDVARQRDGIADALRQAQDQGRTQYVQQLDTLRGPVLSTIEPELRNVDWQKLSSTKSYTTGPTARRAGISDSTLRAWERLTRRRREEDPMKWHRPL